MKLLTEKDKKDIVNLYQCNNSINKIALLYNIGDRRVKKVLVEYGIPINNPHVKKTSTDDYIEKKQERFPSIEGKHYVAISKIDGKIFDDYLNKSGALNRYIKSKLNIDIPSLFKRKKYFHQTNQQWYEQWFDIALVDNTTVPLKKCPYCNWSTKDINNVSGVFMVHLLNEHNKTVSDYLLDYPNDSDYFSKQNKQIERTNRLLNEKNFTVCPICNEKFEKITYWHLLHKHSMDIVTFKKQYPNVKIMSDNMLKQTHESQKLTNLTVSKKRFISKYEMEIRDFLTKNNVKYETNREILIGKELDIVVPDKNIAIEFDGLKWDTEWFGKKSHRYHLDKTELCNNKGYGLIHIFEDEYHACKNIVYNKLLHILGIDLGLPKIMARKCTINEIYKYEAETFLNTYHIQGFSSSTIYYGAFYNEELIAVMSFKNGNLKNSSWELTRFASNYNYICQGIGGKIFKHFIKQMNPEKVISFADRRWTVDIYNNLYTKLGFTIEKINAPDYRYYNDRVDKYKRFHKMLFNKRTLSKKYGFPLTMTETEMAKELGYDRIWDCGLVKYAWKK